MLDKSKNSLNPLLPSSFLLSDLQESVFSGQTSSEHWRRQQLQRISALLEAHEDEIIKALEEDLKKPPTEAIFEIVAIKQELNLAKKNLRKWMQPRSIQVPITLQPGKARLMMEPKGCVLIIGPWNYPFSLTIQPLISVIAAGNTAVLKPSEKAPATSSLIRKLIPNYFSKKIIQVVEGGGETASALLEQPFDHIFFTGGATIGKKVMAAAAKHLTPITLELGGQSPAVVLKNADISVTARRLVWGKALNAGQTCIAPNHLLVEENIKQSLIAAIGISLKEFYGEKPLNSPDLARIINESQFKKLEGFLHGAKKNGQILLGGEIDYKHMKISPTLIEICDVNDPLMSEEIFGPLLPLITIKNLDMAIADIRKRPHPLAMYMFGGTKSQQRTLLKETTSGGVCFNDVILQCGIPELPFGGIGASGIGRYHGFSGFETFSNQKSILERPFWLDIKFRYPPYKLNLDFLKRILG